MLDLRGGATSGKSFKVGDKGVTLRGEDCSGWVRFRLSMDSLGRDSIPFTPTDVLVVTRGTGSARILDSAELDGRRICPSIDSFLYEGLVEANEEAGRVIF